MFTDQDQTAIVGEWAIYLGKFARARIKCDGDYIAYTTAIQYMRSLKCTMVNTYCITGVLQQFEKLFGS